MTQRRADARLQFNRAERFGYVIVGARVEKRDLVAVTVTHGEDHDRHSRPLPEASKDFESIQIGGRSLYIAYAPLESTGWSLGGARW